MVVNQNHKIISDALDCIPLKGDIIRSNYDDFCRNYEKLPKRCGFGGATRLLSMKRPDYFICLNSKNRNRLKNDFKISSVINLNNYWEEVIERIMDSNWWDSPKPSNLSDISIWNARAAFLDAIYYDP